MVFLFQPDNHPGVLILTPGQENKPCGGMIMVQTRF